LALGIGIGSGYLFETTFKREVYSDLTGERGTLMGAIQGLFTAQYETLREKSLLYEGLMHYFVIRFPQRPVALLSFIRDVLGPNDDIVYFSYTKKIHKEKGPAVIGIELAEPGDYDLLIKRMEEQGICYEYLNSQQDLFEFIV
jgi:hypothetical protein